MKSSLTILLALACTLLTGCTITEQTAEDIGTQFSEGIQGRGRIVPNDPTEDNFGPEYR